ncbi:DNA-directed DNA polymerase, partial [Physocladia obscura]
MPTTQLKAATGARTGNGLELFRDLASPDSATQFKAAMTLRSQLQLSFETAHQTDPAKPSGTTTDELPDDAAYALKRLVRGLASSRDRARQGFTLALVELLTVLKQLASVTVDTVVDLVESFNVLSNSLKAQEEREMLFARIFCVHSIVQSGLLTSSNSTSQQFLRVAKVLLACNKAKSYLAQASYSVLIDAAIEVIKSGKENCVNLDLTSFIIEVIKERGMGVEGVWFVAALQIEMRKQKLDFDWKSIFKGTWEHPANILHPSHSARLGKILKDAASTSPKLHPIFPIIISQIFTLDVNAISLGDFWTQIVEEPFFNSATHNYKFVGFLIFEETLQKGLWAVEKGATIDLSVLFSKSFLSLGKGEDAVLFKIAKTTAKKISTISSSSSKLGLKVIFQLIGLNGHQRFDIVTRTKTVEGIVGNLDEPEINTFITYLINLIVSDSGHNNDAAKTISAVSSPNIRMWALDQLQSILRAPKVPKKENWIKRVLHFLCVHSLFSVVKPFDGFEVVDLNAQVREHCRARFFGALAEVNSISLAAVEKKDGDVATTLAAGVMENGEYWAYDLVQFILELDGTGIGEQQQKKKISSGSFVKPVNALEARSLEARNMAVQEISAFRSKVTSLSKAKTPNTALIAQYKSFELLFLHVLLQVYTEPVDAVNILNELKSCADLVFSDTTPPQPKSVSSALSTPTKLAAKKRKVQQEEEENQDSENDEEGEQPNPVDVIVDILLSFLAKPSSLFRGVVENVFRVFCPVLTPNGINLIFDVLRAKSGIAGAAELFQQEGEDGDDDEDDDVDIIDVSEANINGDEKIGTENDDDENGDEEDEWDDDEEEDDDEDDDNESEFEDAAEDVDALKARLTAALGKHAVVDDGREDNGNNSDDDGNESLGDDDMEAFDEKLAAIFRERKNLKVQKR